MLLLLVVAAAVCCWEALAKQSSRLPWRHVFFSGLLPSSCWLALLSDCCCAPEAAGAAALPEALRLRLPPLAGVAGPFLFCFAPDFLAAVASSAAFFSSTPFCHLCSCRTGKQLCVSTTSNKRVLLNSC
jgi:hypothetical protein